MVCQPSPSSSPRRAVPSLAAPQTKGNWSQVAEDLNSLKRLEKEMRTTWFSWEETHTRSFSHPGGFGREVLQRRRDVALSPVPSTSPGPGGDATQMETTSSPE